MSDAKPGFTMIGAEDAAACVDDSCLLPGHDVLAEGLRSDRLEARDDD